MNNSFFCKLNDKLHVNIDQISHFEFIKDDINPSWKMLIYLVRSSSGDRITLNDKEAENFIKFLEDNDRL